MIILMLEDGKDDDDSLQVIEELEKIDDDCDKHGIQFVKIDDRSAAKEHGVKDVKMKQNHAKGVLIFQKKIVSSNSCQQLSFSRSKNQTASRET